MSKNLLIFGDSYSTFKGFIPEGYLAYYSENGRPETDVTQVSETWWYQVVNEAKLNLVLNNSWSGSTICYTGYENKDCSQTSSFIRRLRNLIDEGFFAENNIDKVFVFGGTNDSWCGAPLGEIKKDNWINDDLYNILPAIYCFFDLLKKALPNAEIYCLINTGLKEEVALALEDAAQIYNITPIVFDKIDKQCGHPTIEGMKDIKNAVLNVIN